MHPSNYQYQGILQNKSATRKLIIGGVIIGAILIIALILLLYFLLKNGQSDVWINHYGTKTAYRNHAYQVSEEFKQRAEESLKKFNCRPIHVTAVYRHGSRNPSDKDIQQTIDLHKRFVAETSIHKYLPTQFLKWITAIPVEAGNNLTAEGRSEHQGMGRRMQEMWGSRAKKPCPENDKGCYRFPRPRAPFNLNNTQFYSSFKSRSVESGENFVVGLLGEAIGNDLSKASSLIKEDNVYMRFFDSCTGYVNKVKNNKTIKRQVELFDKGLQMTKLMEDVRRRFHIPDSFNFSTQDVDAMFTFCAAEVIIRRELHSKNDFNNVNYPSPWCAFFTDEERQIWEYKVDLKNYWVKSYPYNISYIPSCILLDRMREFLVNATISNRSPNQTDLRGAFSFGHAETVIPLLTLLGLFKDKDQLTATNYEQNKNRKFRTTALSPMAVNLAFILHECSSSEAAHSSNDYEYRLQMYLNEVPLEWPAFPGRTDITMQEFLHHYSFCWSKSFNFNQTCIAK